MTDLDWLDEYAALTQAAGWTDQTDWTVLEVRGRDRTRLLHTLATNQLDDQPPGHGRETFFTDAKGHIVAHAIVLVGDDTTALVTTAAASPSLAAHIRRYILREDVQLSARAADHRLIYLGGPNAESTLKNLGIHPPSECFHHGSFSVSGHEVSVCRVEIAGPTGFLLDAPRAMAVRLEEAGARPCRRQALTAARIESGWPLDRIDITSDNLPQEVGRNAAAISFTKGCYLGQETIARIESRGHVNRHLVGIRFEVTSTAQATDLTHDSRSVGQTTSSTYSPILGSSLALAYVRREFSAPGTKLHSPTGPAQVVELPLRAPQ